MLNAPAALRAGIDHKVRAFIAGAAPPAATLAAAEAAGIEITHVYGLTEVYGPATVCVKHDEWEDLDAGERARLNGRQGIRYPVVEAATVLDPETMQPVPADGETIGEIMFRGNMTMKGYLKNEKSTRAAFAGGWFHSGDLAVLHPDGYMKVRDRSKDIIISGGENISSLEVEDALYHHPAVLAVGVVAKPDAKWGETPCAFIELKDGAQVSGGGADGALPGADGGVQDPQELRVRPAAQDVHRQDPEVRPARAGQVRVSHRVGAGHARPERHTMTDQPYVLATRNDAVVTLTLNRGERYNPLSREMIAALQVELERVAADRSARVVDPGRGGQGLLGGARPQGNARPRGRRAVAGRALRRVQPHDGGPYPDPAAGDRAGARHRDRGGLSAGVDVRPGRGIGERDLRAAGRQHRRVLLDAGGGCGRGTSAASGRWSCCSRGSPISAATALEWGLVNRVVPADKLDEEVDRFVQIILGRSAAVIEVGKRTFYEQIEQPLEAAYDTASDTMTRNLSLDDAAEGIGAFLGKRAPVWRATRRPRHARAASDPPRGRRPAPLPLAA